MIYFDNAATSFPKAPGVGNAMLEYINDIGVNVGRGSYKEAYEAGGVVFDCREKLLRLFNASLGSELIFTKNVTESINVILKGYLRRGDHVVTSSLEHNAVMRPLKSLEKAGITVSSASADKFGEISEASIREKICDNTRLIIMTHASNVCGTINNMVAIGKVASEKGVPLVVDVAQTAGVIDIDMKAWKAAAICFTGHKSLLGPQGIGGFAISPDFAIGVKPLIEGGTGSVSDSEEQPDMLPDKFESGTPNIPGIFGLNAGIDYVVKTGLGKIYDAEMLIMQEILDFLSDFEKRGLLRIIGRKNIEGRTALISVDFKGIDNSEVAYRLDSEYDVKVRVGMHCAPAAHREMGTFPQGTIRFSFSHFNTREELGVLMDAITQILD